MSGIEAVGAQNISFTGHKEENKKVNLDKNTKGIGATIKEKITKPIKDDFQKTYDTKPKDATPEMVADYVADKAVKVVTAVGGGALLLSKSRKMTNGLTAALKDNWAKMRKSTNGEEARSAFGKITGLITDTVTKVRDNNFDRLKSGIQAGGGKRPGLVKSVKEAVFMPVEKFDGKGFFAKTIDAASGLISGAANKLGIKGKDGAQIAKDGVAKGIKDKLAEVGIGNGEQFVDTALALGAAGLSTSVSLGVADTATKADNQELARAARARKTLDTVDNIAKTAAKLSEIAEAI